MTRVGLTGGCCTGKTTVARMFSSLGAKVINADDIVHTLLRDDDQVKSAVVSAFGEQLLAADGSIRRDKLADTVFNDRQRLKELTDLLYPRVRLEIERFFQKSDGKDPRRISIAEVPLLIEGGALDLYEVIIVVTASYQNQLKRFLQKGGKTKSDLDRRIQNQMDLAQKVKSADHVIANDGSLEETFKQVKSVYDSLCLDKTARGNHDSTPLTNGPVRHENNDEK